MRSITGRMMTLALGVFLCAQSGLRAEEGDAVRALLESKASSVVTVRAVVETEMNFGGQGQNDESREEIHGVIVNASGLILVSNASFASMGDEGGDFQVKRTPVELKVVFDREEKEYDAELVATDKKVNLAFLQIKDLEGREVSTVTFDGSEKPEIGAKVASVCRLEKGYDYAPYVRTATISGSIKKPRKAMMIDGGGFVDGLPVYTLEGNVVGVMTSIESGMSESAARGGGGGRGFGRFRMFGGGGSGSRRFLLPGNVVARLVEQAVKQAADQEDEAESGEEGV